jgi:hypothetical protein
MSPGVRAFAPDGLNRHGVGRAGDYHSNRSDASDRRRGQRNGNLVFLGNDHGESAR